MTSLTKASVKENKCFFHMKINIIFNSLRKSPQQVIVEAIAPQLSHITKKEGT